MRAQNLALAVCVLVEKERVMHLARRVLGREVEPAEVVVVGLDVRAFRDLKAHVSKNSDNLVHDLADRMDLTGTRCPASGRAG